jgi:hypothetical protein
LGDASQARPVSDLVCPEVGDEPVERSGEARVQRSLHHWDKRLQRRDKQFQSSMP